MYRCVLFDLDGTLLDTSQGIVNAVKQMLLDESLASIPEEILHTFIGPPMEDSLKAHYSLTDEKAASLAGIFRKYYAQDEYLFQAKPYPDLFQLLEGLKLAGVKIAVATNKRHYYATRLLEHFGIASYCDVIHGSDENANTKEKVILACLKDLQYGILKDCVLVGDTVHDAKGAQETGIDFIGVTYGFGLKLNDILPFRSVAIVENLATLKKLLME